MKELKHLFINNQKWIEKKLSQDPQYFLERAKEQKPSYLWIGCSDSRVPANEVVALEAGEIFVHRNIANLFLHADLNSLSVLEYAVTILEVKHIIVCGHYGCGGIKAAMQDHHLGLVDNWLRNIRDIYVNNKKELESIQEEEVRYRRLVELNVVQQVMNICHTTIVQNFWALGKPLSVHGWVYEILTGKLLDLNCEITQKEQIDDAYQIKKL